MTAELGQRLKSVRKRRALTQQELADLSGLSVSRIRQLEQMEHQGVRLATLRQLAIALRCRTSDLQPNGATDTEHASVETSELWEPVRRALVAPPERPEDDDVPTNEAVDAAYRALMALVDAHRYRDIAAVLPGLLADAETLEGHEGRAIRARLLNLTAWMLVQNRQFDIAAMTVAQAIDVAPERGIAVGAVNAGVWSFLRQGDLAAAQSLAVKWADDIEPRFSTATPSQLALWGRLWLYVANVGVRDNTPGATDEALSLARAAAARIGREVLYDPNPNRPFGPVTVAQITAECAVISEQPSQALAIAEGLPTAILAPTSAPRLRHRLDIAHAHAQLRQFGDAVGVLRDVRSIAPEWLAQQRYARDILGTIVTERRTLTEDMRELADFVNLEY
ncbi:helix-turn-helix domain-containing protein [Nocardia sp. NPDC050697]|uniref:helix-turn-helix domain-containing protein n=1 Tax=Nocardia sp. NPDC050697 TaxID=3155158 RepID=UPI0033DEB8AD